MDAHVKNHNKEDESKANILNTIDNALNKGAGESSQPQQSEDNPENVPEEQPEDNPQDVPEEQPEDNPQDVPEEQPDEKPQEQPGKSGETPQQSQPSLFSEEYIDNLVQFNPDFEEDSEESTATDD